ncbi:MAG TPA: hypothetical protein VJU84_06490 [Pyrinomonadaceae bacterium]|nr:hypothetical protein [Pyrinomonadaceae bacterium]
MFEAPAIKTARPLLLLRKICLGLVAAYLVIGLTAGYRAYHQIKSVDLGTPATLRAGTLIETFVVTYGRTFVDVRLELIQEQQTETVSTHRIPNNEWAFMDPRIRRVSNTSVLTEDVIKKFQPGPATLRATATGLPQLGHVPPPMMRELVVEIQRD